MKIDISKKKKKPFIGLLKINSLFFLNVCKQISIPNERK